MNLNERLLALGPLGVASTGEGVAVGDGDERVGVGEEADAGEDCEVGFEPVQAFSANAPARTRTNLRTLWEVYLSAASGLRCGDGV